MPDVLVPTEAYSFEDDLDWLRAVQLYARYWYELDPAKARTWGEHIWLRLRLPYDCDVRKQAVFDLAETEERAPAISKVLEACRNVRRRREATETAARAPLPFGTDPSDPKDVFWRQLALEERQAWLQEAAEQFAVIRRPDGSHVAGESPIVRALACQLAMVAAGKASTRPLSTARMGVCPGCSADLVLVDRETFTAKCTGCYADVDMTTRRKP